MGFAKKFGRRYPWDEWFSSDSFILIRGVDYDCLSHGMYAMIRNQASARGCSVSVRIVELDGTERISVWVRSRTSRRRYA